MNKEKLKNWVSKAKPSEQPETPKTKKQAKKAIVEGFFDPIIKEFSEEIREELLKRIENGN